MVAKPDAAPWIERVTRSPAVRSGYASLLAHMAVGLVLALLALRAPEQCRPRPLLIRFDVPATLDDAPLPGLDAAVDFVAAADAAALDAAAPSPQTQVLEPVDPAVPPLEGLLGELRVEPAVDQSAAGIGTIPVVRTGLPRRASTGPSRDMAARPSPPSAAAGAAPANSPAPFASRRGSSRAEAALARGGTAASEQAVERGLAWLAAHQAVDGSWQFDLSGCRCDGACRDPGTLSSSTASTAIAVLPFLGAGSTQLDGPYQQTVSRALYYLISRMEPSPRGGDFCEGTMYGHGTTALVLAEAYGMTGDAMLLAPLREAIRFIETSQDAHGGGWRYLPGQVGDITVTAWQLAALKSASMAGIDTPSPTIDGVRRFLDSVQTANGAAYGYRTPAAKPCTSAIGLLCRMYTGWGDDQEALYRGVTALAKPGPHPGAIYQNFYLSQALLQMNHPVWPRWNAKNRDLIMAQQARFGHETGSWFFADHDTSPGGRLAHTALAVLTLEVYYRLLPIYRQEAVRDGF